MTNMSSTEQPAEFNYLRKVALICWQFMIWVFLKFNHVDLIVARNEIGRNFEQILKKNDTYL